MGHVLQRKPRQNEYLTGVFTFPYAHCMPQKYIRMFGDVDRDDTSIVGGKGANLGEMVQAGFPVPSGFIITSQAYRDAISENQLENKTLLYQSDCLKQIPPQKWDLVVGNPPHFSEPQTNLPQKWLK